MVANATIEAAASSRCRVLALELGLSQPAVSRQLRVLRGAGLFTVRPDARRRSYRVGR